MVLKNCTREWASPIFGTILAVAWKYWGNSEEPAGLQFKIWIWDLLNMKQECFRGNAQLKNFKSATLSITHPYTVKSVLSGTQFSGMLMQLG